MSYDDLVKKLKFGIPKEPLKEIKSVPSTNKLNLGLDKYKLIDISSLLESKVTKVYILLKGKIVAGLKVKNVEVETDTVEHIINCTIHSRGTFRNPDVNLYKCFVRITDRFKDTLAKGTFKSFNPVVSTKEVKDKIRLSCIFKIKISKRLVKETQSVSSVSDACSVSSTSSTHKKRKTSYLCNTTDNIVKFRDTEGKSIKIKPNDYIPFSNLLENSVDVSQLITKGTLSISKINKGV